MKQTVMPTGRWLYDNHIITNLPQESEAKREKCIQQIGIDLTVLKISKPAFYGEIPFVEFDHKLVSDLIELTPDSNNYWFLEPGFYEVVFDQGCKIPPYLMLLIRQRSSLLRSGILLHSSVFDPGYECKRMATFIHVNNPLGFRIKKGARLAQTYAHPCDTVADDDLYGSEKKGSSYQNETN